MLTPGSEVSIPGTLLRVKGARAHVQLSTGELLVTDAATLEGREVARVGSGVEVDDPRKEPVRELYVSETPGRVRATTLKDRQR